MKTSMPDPIPPQRMPDAEDPAIQEARRRRVQDTLAQSSTRKSKTMSATTIAGSGAGTQAYTATKASGTS